MSIFTIPPKLRPNLFAPIARVFKEFKFFEASVNLVGPTTPVFAYISHLFFVGPKFYIYNFRAVLMFSFGVLALLAFLFAERDGNATFMRPTDPRVFPYYGLSDGILWFLSAELCGLIDH